MKWDGVRGKGPFRTDKNFVLVQVCDGSYTAYEIRSGEDAVEDGVPTYYTEENALLSGEHTWWINYGAWRDNVSPDWKHTRWKVETFIFE